MCPLHKRAGKTKVAVAPPTVHLVNDPQSCPSCRLPDPLSLPGERGRQ